MVFGANPFVISGRKCLWSVLRISELFRRSSECWSDGRKTDRTFLECG